MKAIETSGHIDAKGKLSLKHALKARNKNVKVIILFDEPNDEDDKQLLKYATSNPAFEFLKEPEEDIYSVKDGKPLND
jgi:hypothetical protein